MERARSQFFRAEMGFWTRRWTYQTAVERERQLGRTVFSRFQMGRKSRREEAAARREIARRLVLIKEAGLSWRLGYSKLSDYVLESLGISPRGAQELMRTERALASLPATERAYDRGEIGSEHLRLLTRAVKKDTEAEWVDAAKDLTVHGLALRFAANGVRTDLYDGAARGSEAEPTQPYDIHAPAYIKTFWRESVSFARVLAAQKLTEGECLEDVLAELANVAPLREIHPDDDEMLPRSAFEPGLTSEERYRICAEETGKHPPEIAPIEGQAEWMRSWQPPAFDRGPGRAAERKMEREHARHLLPPTPGGGWDALSGERDTLPGEWAAVPTDGAHRSAQRESAVGPSKKPVLGSAQARRARKEAAASLHGSKPKEIDPFLDPRAIDAALRALITRRHRREAAMASHLREMARTRRYQEIHHSTLEDYAREHLDIGRRQMFYLLALDRALTDLPLLRERFLEGRLTMKQALAIGRVAKRETLPAWITRAERTTLRRLEDEIDHWRHLEETRPKVWALLEGLPLPEGTKLTEGEFARVRENEQPAGGNDPSPEHGVHGSARRKNVAGAAEKPVHGSAQQSTQPTSTITAAQLSEAVAADEAADPLPQRMTRIRIQISKSTAQAWEEMLAHLRTTVSRDLPEWGGLALVLKEFWHVWDNHETRRQRRENPTLDRDRWRCQVPACSSMGSGRLQEHHIRFRSSGGSDDPRNLVTLCNAHHKMLHDGIMRVFGEAPDDLTWEMGIEKGRGPYRTYRGQTRV